LTDGSEKITRNKNPSNNTRGFHVEGKLKCERQPLSSFNFSSWRAVICDCITRSELISITLALQNEKHEPTLFLRLPYTLSSTSFPSAHNTFLPFSCHHLRNLISLFIAGAMLPLRIFHTCHTGAKAAKGEIRSLFPPSRPGKRALAPIIAK
jgi:hypothetical protein